MNRDRLVTDLFAIQTHAIEKIATILNDPQYGRVPALPSEDPANHRLFEMAIAKPPQMWATHPSNVDRENNAKRVYVANVLNNRPVWTLFERDRELRKKMTENLIKSASPSPEAKFVNLKDSLEQFDRDYDYLYLNPAYRGNYMGRSVVANVASTTELYQSLPSQTDLPESLASLYPESLTDDLERLRVLENEKTTLKGLHEGQIKSADGIIRHRGKTIARLDLPSAIATVNVEWRAIQNRVSEHDCLCRSVHQTIAAKMGHGWSAYLSGLLQVMHYTEHTERNLRDALGYLRNVYQVITADGNVSGRELKRLLIAAQEIYQTLTTIYDESKLVKLDPILAENFDNSTWSEILGEFELLPPNKNNIGQWISVISSWAWGTINTLSALKIAALEQLLKTEKQLGEAYLQSTTLDPAPQAASVPQEYTVFLPGNERQLQTRLGWWDRFQTADGWTAQILRLLVALGIISSAPIAVATLGL